MNIYNKNITNIFYIFLISHLIIWTIVPSLTNNNLPLDTIEALAWGSGLDWGFSKHPPASAFFVEIFLPNFWLTRLGILFFKSNFYNSSILFRI